MTVKKRYSVGDTVWIYGITKNNVKSTQGIVIKIFTIDYGNYNKEPHYLVEVPTEIEPLLEVRTWHTISQTKDGHVGSVRDAFSDADAAHKMLARTGMAVISTDDEEFTGDGHDGMDSTLDEYYIDEDHIDPDIIHAAMEKSQKDASHGPMVVKEAKPKRRNYPPRKKKV